MVLAGTGERDADLEDAIVTGECVLLRLDLVCAERGREGVYLSNQANGPKHGGVSCKKGCVNYLFRAC